MTPMDIELNESSALVTKNESENEISILANLKFWRWPKQTWVLVLSVVLLMAATATERFCYKMTIDQLTPYSLEFVQLVFAISFIFFSIVAYGKRGLTNKITPQMLEFPHRKIILMAIIDTVQFAGLSIAATGVSPTMTVILLHASTPCIVLTTRYLHPERSYGAVHMRGVFLIVFAILLSISRPVFDLFFTPHFVGVWHSLAYTAFSALHGFATLHKERTLLEWGQPIDIHYISSWLFFYQCVFAVLLAPPFYFFQDVMNGFSGFPMWSVFQNFKDGWRCVLGSQPNTGTVSYDAEDANCSNIFLLTSGYVLSTLVVLTCINTVIQISHRALGRALAAAVLVAFIALVLYDTSKEEKYGYVIGENVGWADICSIVVLLVGLEVYGRDPEPDCEVIANFAPLPNRPIPSGSFDVND